MTIGSKILLSLQYSSFWSMVSVGSAISSTIEMSAISFLIQAYTLYIFKHRNNNFSLKIRPELKIANFLLHFYELFVIFWFNLNNIISILILIILIEMIYIHESCTKKTYNFAPGAANHTFFDSPFIYNKAYKAIRIPSSYEQFQLLIDAL